MPKGAKFQKKASTDQGIPTSSMADLAFLLLIFFMVTTIFKTEDGLEVEMPKAIASVEIPRDRVSHIWIDRVGNISINDKLVHVEQVQPIIYAKLVANPALIVSFNTDKQASFEVVDDVMDQLKGANATRVSFTTLFESKEG